MPDSIAITTVKQLLQQQREDFTAMIETVMRSFNERHDSLQKTIVELKISLEYSQKDLESLKQSTTSMDGIDQMKESLDEITKKLDYLENQSRRNNIVIHGIPETPSESWADTEEKTQDLLRSKFGFTEEPLIERAHRIGAKKASQQRPVVVKFNSFKDREIVLRNAKNLKGTTISVKDDVSDRVLASRRKQMEKLKEAKNNGKIAYFSLDKLIIKERYGTPTNDRSKQVIRPNTRSQSAVD